MYLRFGFLVEVSGIYFGYSFRVFISGVFLAIKSGIYFGYLFMVFISGIYFGWMLGLPHDGPRTFHLTSTYPVAVNFEALCVESSVTLPPSDRPSHVLSSLDTVPAEMLSRDTPIAVEWPRHYNLLRLGLGRPLRDQICTI